MDTENIYSYVRTQENRYKIGNTKIAKYVDFSLSETVQTIYAYLNSKHISGEQDSLGRDKPFFNIVKAARNIWYRATELSVEDILIKPTDSDHVISAFVATQKIQYWMRKVDFGQFLTDWGLTLAGFGSAISKFVDNGKTLTPTVVPWNQMICDTIDFESNPKIEIFEFTASQLRDEAKKKGYDKDVVESLINSPMVRMLITGELQDVKPYFFKIYEVHGMFPVSYLTDNDDDRYEYSQQMHVVSYVRSQESGKYENFSLFRGKEASDPYRLDHLLKEDGRVLSIGSVENLFQSQWMVNHTTKAVKDQLDLASKLIFQTSDPAFVGMNVLSNIENGQILNHKINEALTAVPNGSHDVGSLIEFMNQWKAIGGEINGITDAMAGIVPKSSTSWKMQAMELQQAQMLFDLMKKNKERALASMMRERIIPFVKRQLNDSKQIIAVLNAHDIRKIDSIYVPKEATKRFNKKVIDSVMKNGKVPQDITLQGEMGQVQSEQNSQANVRYFRPSEISNKTWKDIFSDLEWDVDITDTTTSPATEAILSTLNTALQLVMNPAYATNPQAQLIVNKILTVSGQVSPLEISTTPPPPPPQMLPPQQNPPTQPVAAPPQSAGMVGAPALTAK